MTRILSEIDRGEPQAAEELLPLVYDELRKLAARRLAQEAPGQTLQATALVHEAYLRLVDPGGEASRRWNSRGHLFAAAAEAMRRILVNRARDRRRLKRGGDARRVDLERVDLAHEAAGLDILALDEALEGLARLLDALAGFLANPAIRKGDVVVFAYCDHGGDQVISCGCLPDMEESLPRECGEVDEGRSGAMRHEPYS